MTVIMIVPILQMRKLRPGLGHLPRSSSWKVNSGAIIQSQTVQLQSWHLCLAPSHSLPVGSSYPEMFTILPFILIHSNLYGNWNLSFISFSCVMKYYYSFDFLMLLYFFHLFLKHPFSATIGKKLLIWEIQRWVKHTLPSWNLESNTRKVP